MIQGVLDSIVEWLKEILIDCIMNNLTGMFDQINTEIGEVAANVGTTPAAWNAGVFSMIRTLSDTLGGVFAVNSIRLMDSDKGPFVAMPSRKDKDGNYHDICLPITKEMHKALNDAVLDGYKVAVAEMGSRGAEVAQKASMRDQLKAAQQEAAARPAPAAARTTDKGAR